MKRFLAGKVSEIPEGSKKIIQAEGRSVGVYNIAGQYYALRSTCPHQGAELCSGITASYITSSGPGDFVYEAKARSSAALGTNGNSILRRAV